MESQYDQLIQAMDTMNYSVVYDGKVGSKFQIIIDDVLDEEDIATLAKDFPTVKIINEGDQTIFTEK